MKTSQTENQKQKYKWAEIVHFKLAIIKWIILLALIALVATLWYIQSEYSDEYNQKILSQQRYDSREIPARRGDITDRNGTFLATSTKVYNLIIDPSQINSNQEYYLEPTVGLLSEVFGYDKEDLRNLIAEKSDSAYVRYDKQLTFDQMTEFEARKEAVNEEFKKNGDSRRVYGVWFEDSYQRYYPNNSTACNVIGFSYSEGHEGSGGIEQFYNDDLTGTDGREYGYLNEDSTLERVIKSAQDGNTVVSTIDVNVQKIVEKHIADFQKEMGSKTAACIVMDPNTGEVLAMANSHPFDLNNPRDISAYYTQEELDSFDDQQMSDAWNSVWKNFCVTDSYEPGSTSKVFTVAAALEEGSISGNETYNCEGFLEVGGWKIKCNVTSGHGELNVTESIMKSCNVAMMHIARGLGRDKFMKFLRIFGFAQKTGIDLPGEATGLARSAAETRQSDLATNAFGQNYNCTMIQMAAAYSSVINGGSYYEPHVAKQILNSQGAVIKNNEPKLVRQTVSSSTTAFLKNALFKTVCDDAGTGKVARIEGYDIGGKTGTAEKLPRDKKNYLVSFIGFAPVEDPQVLCYVVIDEPNTEDQAHSNYAQGVFKNIMYDLLPYMNIYREGDESSYGEFQYAVFGDTEETEDVGETASKKIEQEAEHIESESVSENQTKAAVEEKKTEKETKPKAESSDRPTPEEIEEEAEIPDALSDISMAETVPELPQF